MASKPAPTLLTIAQVSERLGISPSRVHRLIEDRALLATGSGAAMEIPEVFIQGDQPLAHLAGTVTLLIDGGFDEQSALEWLLHDHEALGTTPAAALAQGRKAEVRRIAQALAL